MAFADETKNDDILVKVADESMEDNQIDNLGKALGIGTSAIYAAQEQNRHGVKSDGSRALMRKWYQGQRASEWKKNLVDALTKAKRQDILQTCFSDIESVHKPTRAPKAQSNRPATDLEPMSVEETVSSSSTDHTGERKWKDCKVQPVNKEKCVPDLDMHYKMWSSLTKGNALIIGNDFNGNRSLLPRPWAQMDNDNMTLLLNRLGYDFRNGQRDYIYRNRSKVEMEKIVTDFTRHLQSTLPQSAVVYISSHGSENGVSGNDGVHLAIPDLLKKFDGILPGKPKVIIIDACWGGADTHGTRVSRPNNGLPMSFMPYNADIFLIHATSYGKVSWSFDDLGSWFVDKLCEVVYADDHELEDLDTIMLRVTRKLRDLEAIDEHRQRRGTQSPTVIKQGVDKKLFFYPGYLE